MSDRKLSLAEWIVTIIALCHLVAVLIASACLWWLGNWDLHRWGLTLTLRILWGVWTVHALAAILTRVTIFGWNFRTYFRLDGQSKPPAIPIRPAKAPWYKSGKVSFSITVLLVSLTGACAIATAVMYILMDVTGEWVYWLVCTIIWSSWWVLSIAIVLTRLAIFGSDKYRVKQNGDQNSPVTAAQQSQDSRESDS